MSADLLVVGLGRMAYGEGLKLQRALAEARIDHTVDRDMLLLVEHPPVVTLGRRGDRSGILSEAALRQAGIEVIETERGGNVTYHGPGQLVAYPILDLRPDARAMRAGDYVRALEQVVIETVAACGVRGERVAGRPGVWAGSPPAKLAALGVRIERGVSRHGLALNVSTNLEWFEAIVPCGIADAEVTSLERLLGGAPPFEAVVDAFLDAFAHVFDSDLVEGAALLEEATAMAETEVAGAS
jgi:lipoyl(octanoyl) transferase